MHVFFEPTESAGPDESSMQPDNPDQPGPFPPADLLNTTTITTAFEVKLPPFHGD